MNYTYYFEIQIRPAVIANNPLDEDNIYSQAAQWIWFEKSPLYNRRSSTTDGLREMFEALLPTALDAVTDIYKWMEMLGEDPEDLDDEEVQELRDTLEERDINNLVFIIENRPYHYEHLSDVLFNGDLLDFLDKTSEGAIATIHVRQHSEYAFSCYDGIYNLEKWGGLAWISPEQLQEEFGGDREKWFKVVSSSINLAEEYLNGWMYDIDIYLVESTSGIKAELLEGREYLDGYHGAFSSEFKAEILHDIMPDHLTLEQWQQVIDESCRKNVVGTFIVQ